MRPLSCYCSYFFRRAFTGIACGLLLGMLVLGVGSPSIYAQEAEGLSIEDGLPVVSWEDAAKVVGRQAIVFGEIVNIGHAKGITFLNFSNDREKRKDFVMVAFEESDEAFGKSYEDLYLNKKVTVRGAVTLFKGGPQMVLAKPEQVTLVDEFPESKVVDVPVVEIGEDLLVGSYNIENLFDAADDPYHSDEGTRAKPRKDMRKVAEVIRELNADVLALQEVENRGYLQQFVNTMLLDMGYQHVVHFDGNDGRGIDVCLISRIPVGAVTSNRHRVFEAHDGGDQRFNRDLLQVELLPPGGTPFEMWIVHLKSNSGGKKLNEPIRLGECREIHRITAKRLKEDPQASFIICGDFNDEFETKTLQTIIGDPPLLKTIFDEIPKEERVTYNREPYRSMIDFLLCSPGMRERMKPGSFRIRFGTDEESGSDHNPIVARFGKGSAAENAPTGQGAAVEARTKAAKDAESGSHAEVGSHAAYPAATSAGRSRVGLLAIGGLAGLGVVFLGALAMFARR